MTALLDHYKSRARLAAGGGRKQVNVSDRDVVELALELALACRPARSKEFVETEMRAGRVKLYGVPLIVFGSDNL